MDQIPMFKGNGTGYMFIQHITWLEPFIYRGMKGVGLEGYMFSQKN